MPEPPQKPFAADPYVHLLDGDWKLKRAEEDKKVLCEIFQAEAEEIYEGSNIFVGREGVLFQFITTMRFLNYVLRNELRDEATILRVLSGIFAVEGAAPGAIASKDRLPLFLECYLEREEKITMLRSFVFTEPYPLGAEQHSSARHLMFSRAKSDVGFREDNGLDKEPEYCSTQVHGACFCARWLNEQCDVTLNRYMRHLGERFYHMRCAVVHNGSPVYFADSGVTRPADVVQWHVSLVDAFSLKRGEFVLYESGLTVPEILGMFRRGLKRCFLDGCHFRARGRLVVPLNA